MMFRKVRNKRTICVIVFVMIFSTYAPLYKANSKTEKQSVLILVDEYNKLMDLEINTVNMVKQVLSRYDLSIEILNFKDYEKGTIVKYDFVIPIVLEKINYNKDLFYDLNEYEKPMFWIGNDLNKYADNNSKYSYIGINTISSIREVTYKESEKFIINKSGKFHVCDFNREKIKIYSTIGSRENEKIYIMNEKNLWYASLIPNEKSLVFIFCHVINEFLGINTVGQSKIFIDIGEVNPYTDQQKIREIANYLYSEDTPFIITVSPIYINNKTKAQDTISKIKGMVKTINYMDEKGGSIVLNGINDIDYEKKEELNLDVDETIGNQLRECVQNKIYPLGIKEYNYSLRLKNGENLNKYFSTFIHGNQNEYGYGNKIIYPYMTKGEESFNVNFWENLECHNTKDKMWFQKFKDSYRLISINKQFVAGVSFNSSEDIDNLKKIVEFLKTQNISFVDLKEYNNWVKYEGINIVSNKGEVSIDYKVPENNYSNDNASYITQINRFLIVVLIIFCVVFISIFIYYKKINKNKLFRR